MKKGIFALSLGTFTLGMSEYIMMSILPDIADSLHITIAQAGQLITAYALGVGVGAPLTVLIARNYPLRHILIGLVSMMVVGNLLFFFANHNATALIARFISGLPHGAFFSVGVLVANKLADKGKETSAIAWMVMGMTAANLGGVPLGNWVSALLSWRVIFLFTAICGGLTLWAILAWVPNLPAMPRTNIKGLFQFLRKREPWMLMTATVLGSGGLFCWYSYINPLMTDVAHMDINWMPLLMFLAGGSMCIGNYLGGHFSDRFTPTRTTTAIQITATLSLFLIWLLAAHVLPAALLMCVCTACLFGVSAPMQQLLYKYSKGGEMMGGALVQLSFNLGNAVGAVSGGIAISTGLGVRSTPLIGAVILAGAVGMLIWFGIHINKVEKA